MATPQQLARKGRGGDTMVGHLTPGEVVVPAAVLAQPGMRGTLGRGFRAAQHPMGRYTVGGRDDSRNPRTGMREYRGGGPEGTGDPGPGGGGEGAPSRTSAHIGDPTTTAAREAAVSRAEARERGRTPAAPPATMPDPAAARQEREAREAKEAEDRESAWGIGAAILGAIAGLATGGIASAIGMAGMGMKGGKAAAGLADTLGIDFGGTRDADPAVAAATGHTPSRTPGAGPEGADRHPAAAVTRPGSAEAGQPEARPAKSPLAALTGGDEAGLWRPQPVAQDVTWLSRVNADIERARQAGRQRAVV